ncbi:hypothetical protein EKO27_g7932 [Xylaria grammica]|uniref:GH18 domain-containing protein n=1 Tax=Xylaria grammica TaxID=363999 RepID=A0A439CY94_9PEZI|nr:hypothetical protein EKO27_g7932 [Xylaria grammica]
MDEYGFPGVNIDSEYPEASNRSGDTADTENLVWLVKDMRAAFGTTYRISVTIPASYWYPRWFDLIVMEPHYDQIDPSKIDSADLISGPESGDIPNGNATCGSDPSADETEGDDPEDEDENDFYAYEFSLPLPVYVDLNSGAGPSETISPPTLTPHPPGPDPAIEARNCYSGGAETDRDDMIRAVSEFCRAYEGIVLDASNRDTVYTLNYSYNYYSEPTGGSGAECFFIGLYDVTIQLSVTATNERRFMIDGGSAKDE